MPTKKKILSGIQPTGQIHLGNYFGAIKHHIDLSKDPNNTVIIIIADYHALTSSKNANDLYKNVIDIYKTYVALGFNFGTEHHLKHVFPDGNYIIRQSSMPELIELAWILACCTGKGTLDRAHSFKDKIANNIDPSCGLYFYPILMAADILMFDADYVPVGKDQHQHVQIAQQLSKHFNTVYKTNLFKYPEPLFSENPLIPGIDGRKMSKSYNNTIPIFAEHEDIKSIVSKIKTDSTPLGQPLNHESCNIYNLIKLFYPNPTNPILDQIINSYKTGVCQLSNDIFDLIISGVPKYRSPFGYGASKQLLIAIIKEYFF